jgi:hypothetical protein
MPPHGYTQEYFLRRFLKQVAGIPDVRFRYIAY